MRFRMDRSLQAQANSLREVLVGATERRPTRVNGRADIIQHLHERSIYANVTRASLYNYSDDNTILVPGGTKPHARL